MGLWHEKEGECIREYFVICGLETENGFFTKNISSHLNQVDIRGNQWETCFIQTVHTFIHVLTCIYTSHLGTYSLFPSGEHNIFPYGLNNFSQVPIYLDDNLLIDMYTTKVLVDDI